VAAVAFSDFLTPMLLFDQNQRATAEQCLSHPWLSVQEERVVEVEEGEEEEVEEEEEDN